MATSSLKSKILLSSLLILCMICATFTFTACSTLVKSAGSISYEETTITKIYGDNSFTNPLTNTGDGIVRYQSSNTSVATINESTGAVTIVGIGDTTITATVEDSTNCTYATKTASYTLSIKNLRLIDSLKEKIESDVEIITFGLYKDYSSNVAGLVGENVGLGANGKSHSGIKLYQKDNKAYVLAGSYVEKIVFGDCLYMFGGLENLKSVVLNDIDTSNVTNMRGMFEGCSGLTTLDLSSFDTSNVTDMNGMFFGCMGLTSLDVSNFDTSKVIDMSTMFYFCSKLTALDVSNFDTSKVTDMSYMFTGCSGLTSLDVSNFDTSNVTDMSTMFYFCRRLTSLDVSNFDTSNVTDMSDMFSRCSNLTTIYVGNGWTTRDVNNEEDSESMFFGCTKLVGGNGTTYNSEITDKTYAVVDTASTPGYLTLKN